MARLSLSTVKAVWMPTNQSGHENDDNAFINAVDGQRLTHFNAPPTITHGNKTGWSNFGRLSSADNRGKGVYEKSWTDGSVSCAWGSTGSKHTEIFRIGEADSCRWMPYIKGVGFKVFRHRTDSTDFTNNNAAQHCTFLKRYGMRFKNRNDSSERFWSSSVLATDGKAKGHTYGYKGGVATDEFYRVSNWGSDNYRDWLLSEFWINLATEDSNKAGSASTNVYIYDLRFYYDSQAGSNQLVKGKFRPWADRNKAMFG